MLAECESELAAARPYMADCVARHNDGAFTAADAAKAKLWATELQGRITDKCLQLFGGYGFMTEYPISLAYADARVARIYGGTSEIMKTIIAKDLPSDRSPLRRGAPGELGLARGGPPPLLGFESPANDVSED